MRQASSVLYISIDSFISQRGAFLPGLDEFTAALDHEGIPTVWLTSRSRLHLDEPRRRLGHTHPFIAEDGSAIYLPEGYFHLRPSAAPSRGQKSATLRLGRFICIPIAEVLPAAAQALEDLSEETAVPIVALRAVSPRELAQNTGLPESEASLARQRDFDELFFFAGASEKRIQRFLEEGRRRKLQFRQHGALWSVAIGASIQRCIGELSKLYDRALRRHAPTVGIAKPEESSLLSFCDQAILLEDHRETVSHLPRGVQRIPFHGSDGWEQLLGVVISRT